MLIPKNKYIRDVKHRRFIASLPCLIYGTTDVQCAHIRHGNPCGMGIKPSDMFCVPLSVRAHTEQHDTSEVEFWREFLGVKRASKLAKDLYKASGNREKALRLIAEWKLEQTEL